MPAPLTFERLLQTFAEPIVWCSSPQLDESRRTLCRAAFLASSLLQRDGPRTAIRERGHAELRASGANPSSIVRCELMNREQAHDRDKAWRRDNAPPLFVCPT